MASPDPALADFPRAFAAAFEPVESTIRRRDSDQSLTSKVIVNCRRRWEGVERFGAVRSRFVNSKTDWRKPRVWRPANA